MTKETEQLKVSASCGKPNTPNSDELRVAKEILHGPAHLTPSERLSDEHHYDKMYEETVAILSHHFALCEKRGAVKGLKIALAEWNSPEMDEYDVWLNIVIVISNMEREIKAIEAGSLDAPAAKKAVD